MTSNVGLWDRWYADLSEPAAYGDDTTYLLGAEFLTDCPLIEDWGCGKGWFRTFVHPDRYRGVDGSRTPFADVTADLATYRSEVPGVFLRHVLEHDYRWEAILANAAASATERLAVILFTPLGEATREIAFAEDPGVPDISFALDDLLAHLTAFTVTVETLTTATQYGTETILRCLR